MKFEMSHTDASEEGNRLAAIVLDEAIRIHRALGPGLLERAYQAFLVDALMSRGLFVRQEVPVEATFEGRTVPVGLRLDILVEERLVVEIKAVTAIEPVHKAQLLTYLRMTGCEIGLIINFHSFPLGFRRVVLSVAPGEGGSAGASGT